MGRHSNHVYAKTERGPGSHPIATIIIGLLYRITACEGASLVLDGDLSMQLVMSPELQAIVRNAGLPVELQCDRPCSPLLHDDWLRLNVPVRHRTDCSRNCRLQEAIVLGNSSWTSFCGQLPSFGVSPQS